MRRGLTPTVVVSVATAVAALLLLVWGAGNGTPLVSSPQGTWGPPPISFEPLPEPVEPAPPPAEDGGEPPGTAGNLADLLLVGFLLLVVAALLILLKVLASREKTRRRQLADQQDHELVALLEASGDDVRYRALAAGDPRNAVVACWVALEDAVHRSGLREDRSETAGELTARVLSRWEVDPGAIRTLSEAYREARFSRHPVTEDLRHAAVDALERIHTDLGTRVRAEQGAEAGSDAGADR